MRFSLSLFQLLLVSLTVVVFLGTTQIGMAIAAAIPFDDDCCRSQTHGQCCEEDSQNQGPCSGAADDCHCPCCPLPVIGEAHFPIHVSSIPVPVALAPGRTPASVIAPSLDHPPE